MRMPYKNGAYSHKGGRESQEDFSLVSGLVTQDGTQALLAVVADGIGGETGGNKASILACQIIGEYVQDKAPASADIASTLVGALRLANQRIFEQTVDSPHLKGMGTTCVAAILCSKYLYLAHMGDSRAYLLRKGRLHQLTVDHSWSEQALRAGRTADELRSHPNRGVINRYLGSEFEMEIDTCYLSLDAVDHQQQVDCAITPLRLLTRDRILLCTDGIWGPLSEAQLGRLITRHTPERAVQELANRAVLQAGAEGKKADNATAVVLEVARGVQPRVANAKRVWGLAAGFVLLLVIGVIAWWQINLHLADSAQVNLVERTPSRAVAAKITVSGSATAAGSATRASSPTVTRTRPSSTLVASSTPTLTPTPSTTPTNTPTNTPTPSPTATPELKIYKIVLGDNVEKIAARFGVTKEEILEINPDIAMHPNDIIEGHSIRIPNPIPATPSSSATPMS